jgi:hypothetical protein
MKIMPMVTVKGSEARTLLSCQSWAFSSAPPKTDQA